MTEISTLLAQLGWPAQAVNDRGALTFTAATGDMESQRSTSAALLVGHDKIQARIRSAVDGTSIEPHLEVIWNLSGQEARLVSFIKDGTEQPLDISTALSDWQNAVNRLGVQPKFQQMAPRNTPQNPSRQVGM